MFVDTIPMSLNDVLQLYSKQPSAQVQQVNDGYVRPPSAQLETALLAAKTVGEKARAQAIADAGLGVGIKTGVVWQITVLMGAVQRRARDLDVIYDFSRYMIHDRVVPPVITEARDLYNQSGSFELRLSGAMYAIESQARFASVAPSWRDYFNFPRPTVDIELLQKGVAPRGEYEERIWRLAVQQGWGQGVEQGNLIIKYAFDRLNRDIKGMIRFHTFVNQGKITLPTIATESIAVTKAGETMAVDETLLRITTLPEFNGKLVSWSAGVTSSGSSQQNMQQKDSRTIQKDFAK